MSMRPANKLPPAPVTSVLQIASYYPGFGPLSYAATALSLSGFLPDENAMAVGRHRLGAAGDGRRDRLVTTVRGFLPPVAARRGMRPRGAR